MRLIVFGSRTYPYPGVVHHQIGQVWRQARALGDDEMHIISGGADGADTYGEEWADTHKRFGVTKHIITINNIGGWAAWPGRTASYVRNCALAIEGQPTHGLGFPWGEAKGTMLMKKILEQECPGMLLYMVPDPYGFPDWQQIGTPANRALDELKKQFNINKIEENK